jgi:NAD(P)-dependent dehydrogenase (short-subunit alcohol dehydrogenase family)
MQKAGPKRALRKRQSQDRPGNEYKMEPRPVFDHRSQEGCGKLFGKVALITGGDSGIGRAVAVLFAKEGADVAVVYLSEHKDAEDTKKAVEAYGQKCLLISADISKEKKCYAAVEKTAKQFGKIDILVNNAATQYEQKSLEDISTKQLLETFQTNIFSFFWITKTALPHIPKGGSIINTTSVTAYRGSAALIDYSSTKGAIVSFTRSLSANLVDKGIRVNAVAPGPVWTPLIVSSFEPKKVAEFGSDAPMKRAGEPIEIASCYLFLASDDASYINGQVLHPNGGEIING